MRNNFELIPKDLQYPAAKQPAVANAAADLGTPLRLNPMEKKDSSESRISTEAATPPVPSSQKRVERRQQRRACLRLPVRLRPADSKDPMFEEVRPTVNACRTNLYIVSEHKFYYQGMRLRVTFPFDSAQDSVSKSEDNAEVVRVDPLPDGCAGIAVVFLRPTRPVFPTAPSALSLGVKRGRERRFAVRRSVSATATVTDLNTMLRLEARCSDLSVSGCYIDTLNPFPESSILRLQLSDQQRIVEVAARVVTRHLGMGMGVAFDELGIEQTLMLINWLGSQAEHPLPVLESCATADLSGVSNRDLVVKFLQLLKSNGKLTRAQIASLLSDSKSG